MVHVVERLHVDAERRRDRVHVQPEGGQKLEELHLLAGQRVRQRRTRVVALGPAAPLQQPQRAFLWFLDFPGSGERASSLLLLLLPLLVLPIVHVLAVAIFVVEAFLVLIPKPVVATVLVDQRLVWVCTAAAAAAAVSGAIWRSLKSRNFR